MHAIAHDSPSTVLSWSRIELLRQCPLAYKRRHIDRAPEPWSQPREVGSLIHRWAELVLARDLADEDALALLREMVAVVPEEAGADAMQIGEGVIRRGLLPSLPSDAEGVELEARWARLADGTPCDWDDPAALIRGVTDRRWTENGGTLAAVQDWKTSHVAYDPGDQMRIYAWAEVCARPEVERVAASLHFLRSGAVRRQVYDADELRETVPPMLLAIQADLRRRIAGGDWGARVSSACGHCDYRASCPIMRSEVVPILRIESRQNAQTAAVQLKVLQTQAKDLEDALRSWARQHGPIEADGERVGFLPREKTEVVDTPALVRALQARGVAPQAIWAELKLGKASAEKLAASTAPRGQKGAAKEAFVAEMVQLGAMQTRTTTEWKRAAIGAEEGDTE